MLTSAPSCANGVGATKLKAKKSLANLAVHQAKEEPTEKQKLCGESFPYATLAINRSHASKHKRLVVGGVWACCSK